MAPGRDRILGDADVNENGGFYKRGDAYSYPQKAAIVSAFFNMWEETYPERPSYGAVAKETKVSKFTVRKFIMEFEENGKIEDPNTKNWDKKHCKVKSDGVYGILSLEQESFLLSLRAEEPSRPNKSYVQELYLQYGRKVSSSFISKWFKNRFQFEGTFRKSIKVPLDKFREANWFKYYEYRLIMNKVSNHKIFNFCDEKHITNHNGTELKIRKCPITGNREGVPVSGDFRETFSIIACVSPNPAKQQHAFVTCGKGNNTSSSFKDYVELMVTQRFLNHNEVLVMDNAAIHTGRDASGIEDFLWNTIVDGQPLRILVIYLPPRTPELNPIELVFHILTRRIRSFHYRHTGPVDEKTIDRIERVFEDLTLETIQNCCRHCGYRIEE